MTVVGVPYTARTPSASGVGPGWRRVPIHPTTAAHVPGATGWACGSIFVVSSLNMAELPDRAGTGPQWHISISDRGRRPKPKQVRRVLRAFGMEGAEEDNHHPGVARNFWLVCDPAHRVACECKVDEVTQVEPDGYAWTNPAEGAGECRGCEYERMFGRPCSIHRAETAG